MQYELSSKENFKFINLNVLKQYASLFPETILGLSDHTHGHETVLGLLHWVRVLLKNILRMTSQEKARIIHFHGSHQLGCHGRKYPFAGAGDG